MIQCYVNHRSKNAKRDLRTYSNVRTLYKAERKAKQKKDTARRDARRTQLLKEVGLK